MSSVTVFENYRKSRIQHCERRELRLHFEWTKVNKKLAKYHFWKPEACGQTVFPDKSIHYNKKDRKCQSWKIELRHYERFSSTVCINIISLKTILSLGGTAHLLSLNFQMWFYTSLRSENYFQSCFSLQHYISCQQLSRCFKTQWLWGCFKVHWQKCWMPNWHHSTQYTVHQCTV